MDKLWRITHNFAVTIKYFFLDKCMKLLVLDIDGVLSQGEAQAFDLSLLGRLRKLNQASKTDSSIPSVTINTGRPSPYVEALMQAIDGWQPALYENGAGLYFPLTYEFRITALLTSSIKSQLNSLINLLDKEIVQSGKAYWQPGKTVCYTLFSYGDYTVAELAEEVAGLAASSSEDIAVAIAGQALNIYPKLITKGTGVEWLAEATDIALSEMAGVGDSDGDIDFLRLLSHCAAPDNATVAVKSIVNYVSRYPTTAGLNDILDYWKL
jgi:hydroxymethylpyrimidine pyrophosphatase-like HAD family hydrolase